MSEPPDKIKTYHYNNPMETFPGLTIDDLNRYLPAIQTEKDMSMVEDKDLHEGVFLAKCMDGFTQLPSESIDLIISTPPKDNWDKVKVQEILFKSTISGTKNGYKNLIVF